MIHDENLKNSHDYNEGQKEAAHRILIELVNLFGEYRDDIRLVGGWVPDLMFPGEGHIGSVDVDILINHHTLKDSGYLTMSKILIRNGYAEHPEKYFSFIKQVEVGGIAYDVDVDILAGMYGGTQPKRKSQHIQGIKALKATGGDFAFNFDPQKIRLEAKRPDGAVDVANINVIAVVPYLVMKTAALGRGKAKDVYDIYFLVRHYIGGTTELGKLFADYRHTKIIQDMKVKLSDKFASPEHSGPIDVSNFIDPDNEDETAFIRRDAYEQIHALLVRI